MNKMKYVAPAMEVHAIQVECMTATSILNGTGGGNVNITPGDEFNGEFNGRGEGAWNIWS